MTRAEQAPPDLADNTIVKLANLTAGEKVYEALSPRSNILTLMDQALNAVITPVDAGGFSHIERAALACRIARINNNPVVAQHFDKYVTDAKTKNICEPTYDGGVDRRLKAVLFFTDFVSSNPKDFSEPDITALKSAGVTEADIVRLAELNGYMAFVIRVVEGLALLRTDQ